MDHTADLAMGASVSATEPATARSWFLPLLTLTTLWVTYQGLLTEQLHALPRILSKLDELLLVLLGLMSVGDMLRRGRLLRRILDPAALAFVAIALVSLMVNRSWILNAVLGLVVLLQYYLVGLAIRYHRISYRHAQEHVHLLLGIGLTTAPIAIAQYVLFGRFSDGVNPSWDRVIGPFFPGTANVFAYFCGFLILILLAQLVYDRDVGAQRKRVLMVLALCLPFLLCSGKSAYYLMPVALAAMFYRVLRSPRLLFRVVVASAVMVAAFWLVSTKLYGVDFGQELSLQRRVQENMTTDDKNMGRLLYLKISQELMNERPLGNVFGLGPGMFSSYPARELGSPYLANSVVGEGSVLIPSDVVAVRTEYGYLGLAAFVLIAIGSARQISRWTRRTGAPVWIPVAHRGCTVMFLLGAFAELAWETPVTAYYYWLISALLYVMARGYRPRFTAPMPLEAR